jgi:hypothetical protein
MAWKMKKIAVCDVCGNQWLPLVENPTICASKKCRSRLWNRGGIDGRTKEAKAKRGKKTRTANKS